MTALQIIIKEAKAIRRKSPKMEWKKAVSQASAIYASKHKGKSPVGKKHAVKKKATKRKINGKIEILNAPAWKDKKELEQMRKGVAEWLNEKRSKKTAKKKAVKKVGVIKKKAIRKSATKRKPTEKAVLKSIKHAVSVQKAHMSGVSHHAIDRIKSAMVHLNTYQSAYKKYMSLPLKERKLYSSAIKKTKHLIQETKTHINQLKKSI